MMPGDELYQPPQDRDWEDLLGPVSDPSAAISEARRSLGEDVPPARRVPAGPDVHGLAEELGL